MLLRTIYLLCQGGLWYGPISEVQRSICMFLSLLWEAKCFCPTSGSWIVNSSVMKWNWYLFHRYYAFFFEEQEPGYEMTNWQPCPATDLALCIFGHYRGSAVLVSLKIMAKGSCILCEVMFLLPMCFLFQNSKVKTLCGNNMPSSCF